MENKIEDSNSTGNACREPLTEKMLINFLIKASLLQMQFAEFYSTQAKEILYMSGFYIFKKATLYMNRWKLT